MDNMRFYVEQLTKYEEAITLLYNAAANCFTLNDEDTLYKGIKEQEAAVSVFCKQEKERLAAIIRKEGKVIKDMSLSGFPFTSIIYDYNGEQYIIETEFEETTSIEYCEE